MGPSHDGGTAVIAGADQLPASATDRQVAILDAATSRPVMAPIEEAGDPGAYGRGTLGLARLGHDDPALDGRVELRATKPCRSSDAPNRGPVAGPRL